MEYMTTALFLFTAFGACIVGKICGMGGGVIIKPVLDAFGVLDVGTINFLSSCTVLGMSCWSVGQSIMRRESAIDFRLSTPLALGAAAGGMLGKQMFTFAAGLFSDAETAGGVQAGILMTATFLTLLYTINQNRIATKKTRNPAICTAIGLALGMLGAFLGIGGGPFNMVVLYYFFSMPTKAAAQNSLYIILFSQAAGVLQTFLTAGAPTVSAVLLGGMLVCGVIGSEAGRVLNQHMDDRAVTRCFEAVMGLIMLINGYNMWRYFT